MLEKHCSPGFGTLPLHLPHQHPDASCGFGAPECGVASEEPIWSLRDFDNSRRNSRNASKHQWCKSLLLGKPVPIDDPDLQSLKFWPRIQYIPLPRHEVPGLDYKAAFVGGHFVIPFAGVAHAQKMLQDR